MQPYERQRKVSDLAPALRRLAAILVLMSMVVAGHAQVEHSAHSHEGDAQIIHVTDSLSALPRVQQTLRDFHARKAAGLFPAKREPGPFEVKEERTFKVFNFVTEQTIEVVFETVGEDQYDPAETGFRLWVESAELDNGNVTDDVISGFITALGFETPENSVNPEAIIAESGMTVLVARRKGCGTGDRSQARPSSSIKRPKSASAAPVHFHL